MTVFDVVLLPFPFSDLSTTKQRPCLVLAALQPKGLPDHYVVAMVTSQMDGLHFPRDTRVTKWREDGLPKPSKVRLAKVVTIERSLIRKKIGTIEASDATAIVGQFRKIFANLLRAGAGAKVADPPSQI